MDIVTDTLHASSSDLITWNILVMLKTGRIREIPTEWLQIATASLPRWDERELCDPSHPDTRRGYARVTPVGLTSAKVSDQPVLKLDAYPLQGLGFYDESEITEQFSLHKWSSWTKREVQPMHVDQGLLNLLGQKKSGGSTSAQPSATSQDVKMSVSRGRRGHSQRK